MVSVRPLYCIPALSSLLRLGLTVPDPVAPPPPEHRLVIGHFRSRDPVLVSRYLLRPGIDWTDLTRPRHS